MDKVAMYKEWIYEGEIEKTALNAAMKRMRDIMKNMHNQTDLQKAYSVKRIRQLIKGITSKNKWKPESADKLYSNDIEAASLMRHGMKGGFKDYGDNGITRSYKYFAGRTERDASPTLSKNLQEKIKYNKWHQQKKREKIDAIKW